MARLSRAIASTSEQECSWHTSCDHWWQDPILASITWLARYGWDTTISKAESEPSWQEEPISSGAVKAVVYPNRWGSRYHHAACIDQFDRQAAAKRKEVQAETIPLAESRLRERACAVLERNG